MDRKKLALLNVLQDNDESEINNDQSCVQTNALVHVERSRCSGTEKIWTSPYFGRFAGQCILFEVKRSSNTLVSVKVKLESATDSRNRIVHRPLTTLYHTVSSRHGQVCCQGHIMSCSGVREKCVRFINEDIHTPVVDSLDVEMRPPALTFLCEKKLIVHMGEVDCSKLPYIYSYLNPKVVKFVDIFIQVWSCEYRQDCSMLRLKIKPRILIQELKWIVCSRLPLASNPASIEFYKADSLENISPHCKLQSNQNTLHCIMKKSLVISSECTSFPLVVSIIGQGINQVMVNRAMTLCQFQKEIRSKFSLRPDSFVYFPALTHSLRGTLRSTNAVRMSAIIDASTILLIDSKKAKLPIINGVPSTLVDYEQVPLYQTSIADLGMIDSAPVMAFEVTGPTIPLVFKTTRDQSNKDFAVVSEHSHAVSVSPHWTVATLLKYIECVSGFPCKHLCLRGNVFPLDSTLKLHLTCRTWVVHAQLVRDIPKVTY